ncbi:MAG: type II toxin-antitoxin system PemK/MazF family toxin [Candidatus Moranbacteria bacterium]|nr:type II toxin-antitoxin system PemK/MazF family toxin [Candidatus Moranbacteria bacterium]
MEKDFDGWNERKKKVNNKRVAPYFEIREVWWCSLGLNVGFEQDGTSNLYRRPVLVLKKWSSDTCLILPVTSSLSRHPYRISIGTIGGRASYVIVSQAKTIDARRFGEKITTLDSEHFEYVRKTTRESL